MSSTPRTTLKPGDLLWWEPGAEEENTEGVALAVSEDGDHLLFQFARLPWDQMDPKGLTTREAESVLRGEAEFHLPGHIYKCYDEQSGRSFNDPALEAE